MELEPKSRTQKKRDAQNLQELGKRLIALSSQQLKQIEIPEEILLAVEFAKTIKKHGAYRRQVRHLGALMRAIDSEPVCKALELIELGDLLKAREIQKIERWRDELVAGDDALVGEIINQYPETDRQRLIQLVRNARKELLKERPPKSSRSLFRYLRQIVEDSQ